MSKKDLQEKIQELKEWEALKKEMDEIMEEIKDEIKNELEALDTELLEVGIFTVRWQTVVTNRFDATKFKKDHNDVYEMYKKESISKRFTVSA